MKATILIISLALCSFGLKSQQIDNTLTPEEFGQGWELLFDGESLKGWKAYNGNALHNWKVKDNSLFCDGTAGGDDIMTVERFEDFDLKFDWKIGENGNSGVIYKVREGKQWSQPYLTGIEYQVFGETNDFSKTSTGSLYDVYAPSEDKKINPSMQWNYGRIRVSNGLITHWVNGVIVVQCQLYSKEWNQKVAESKWKNRAYFARSPFGHIDFQNHGHNVWYKNIKIRKL